MISVPPCLRASVVKLCDMDYYDQVREAADAVRRRIGEVPSIGIVLGSGLGGFVESIDDAVSMGTANCRIGPPRECRAMMAARLWGRCMAG